jgi:Glutaredoxin-like domain (DUF836)
MPDLLVYSRHGCHPCEVLIEELLELVRGLADVRVLDIDSRDDWRETYNTRVPVVELDGHVLCEYTLDRELVLTALSNLAEAG